MFIDCSCMIVTHRDLDNDLVLEISDLNWHRLSSDIDIAKTAEFPIAPRIHNPILSHSTRVVVSCRDVMRQMSLFLVLIFKKRVRFDLMRHFYVLINCC